MQLQTPASSQPLAGHERTCLGSMPVRRLLARVLRARIGVHNRSRPKSPCIELRAREFRRTSHRSRFALICGARDRPRWRRWMLELWGRGMAPCARGSHSTRKRRGPIRPGMRPCESGLDRVRFRGSAARPLLRRSRERRGRHAWACSPLREERCRHPHSLRLSHGICKWHKQAAAAPWHSNRSATARRHATWLNSVMRGDCPVPDRLRPRNRRMSTAGREPPERSGPRKERRHLDSTCLCRG